MDLQSLKLKRFEPSLHRQLATHRELAEGRGSLATHRELAEGRGSLAVPTGLPLRRLLRRLLLEGRVHPLPVRLHARTEAPHLAAPSVK
eukprot:1131802-Prorocentrum_minimum.AAC.1